MTRRRGRIAALREVFVFQLKLALDAIRDVAISPLSLAAAVVDFLFPDGPRWFYRVLGLGRRSEEIIGLWRIPDDAAESPDQIAARLQQLEDWLRREATSPENRDAIRAWSQRMGQRLNPGRSAGDSAEPVESVEVPSPPRPPPPRM